MKQQEAPGKLEIVRAFVNSLDHERHTDEFATDEGLAGWLVSRSLVAECRVLPGEREWAVEVREAIRLMTAGHPECSAVLDDAARSAGLTVRFELDAEPVLVAATGGVTGAVGTLLGILTTAVIDGTWRRMKVCRAPDCRWMFYDRSKNRTGAWCQMAECGNRAKARAYRARSRSVEAPA